MKMTILTKHIEAELNLLKRIHDSPYAYLKDRRNFIEILRTQKNFAKFSDENLGILSYSLNTQKYYCDKYHLLGYNHINNLRISAYKKLISLNKKSKPISKKASKPLHTNIASSEQIIKNNLMLMSIMLYLKEKLQEYAFQSQNKEIQNDFIVVNRQIEKILGTINEK